MKNDESHGGDARSAHVRRAVGNAIAKARDKARLSQEAVAEKLGVGPLAVSRMERGVIGVSADRLIQLAEIFACRADELLLPGSVRIMDQVGEIAQIMETLAEEDREFAVDFLRNFSRYKHAGRLRGKI
jgi:transcriptional regulator with XRE-family HTH domain